MAAMVAKSCSLDRERSPNAPTSARPVLPHTPGMEEQGRGGKQPGKVRRMQDITGSPELWVFTKLQQEDGALSYMKMWVCSSVNWQSAPTWHVI